MILSLVSGLGGMGFQRQRAQTHHPQRGEGLQKDSMQVLGFLLRRTAMFLTTSIFWASCSPECVLADCLLENLAFPFRSLCNGSVVESRLFPRLCNGSVAEPCPFQCSATDELQNLSFSTVLQRLRCRIFSFPSFGNGFVAEPLL